MRDFRASDCFQSVTVTKTCCDLLDQSHRSSTQYISDDDFLSTPPPHCLPGALTLTVTPDRGTNIRIWSLQVKGCQVCSGSGRQRHCSSFLQLKDSSRATAVEFTCSAPQDQFSVEITRNIGTVWSHSLGLLGLVCYVVVLSCRYLLPRMQRQVLQRSHRPGRLRIAPPAGL